MSNRTIDFAYFCGYKVVLIQNSSDEKLLIIKKLGFRKSFYTINVTEELRSIRRPFINHIDIDQENIYVELIDRDSDITSVETTVQISETMKGGK